MKLILWIYILNPREHLFVHLKLIHSQKEEILIAVNDRLSNICPSKKLQQKYNGLLWILPWY